MVSRVLAPLAAAVVLAATACVAAALAGGPPPREVAVIVELDAPPALRTGAVRTAQARVGREHAALRDAARSAGLRLRERHAFSLTVNALAVTVAEDDRDALERLPGVAAVHPDVRARASLGVSVPHIGAPEIWERTDGSGGPVKGTGVDVAVIDTGVDGTHPALAGRVVAGADFVQDDGDPADDHGHGTHVAGIVAARGEPTGVAPDATVVAYKVLDRNGSGSISDAIAGIEAAVDPKNDHRAEVINMSLSAPEAVDGPLTAAAQAAAESGVVVVAAAGNSGPGESTIGAPAQAPGVLTVGASITDFTVPSVRMTAPRALELRSARWEPSANPPQEEVELDVVDIGEGGLEGHDVEGKAVLIDAPGPPWDLALEAERRGAVLLLIHGGSVAAHEFATGSGDDGRFDSLVALRIDEDAAAALREAPARVGLSGEDATDRVAAFSSRGPTAGFAVKPELVAPGVEIRSTVPKALHPPGVVRFSGTSMAAPHAAGAAALLRQLHPDWPADAVRAALAGTAEPLDTLPAVSGAGRLDVAAAADAAVVAETAALSFGLAGTEGRIDRTRSLGLVNLEDEPAVVRITARDPVRATPSSFTLAAGERRSVAVRLDAQAPAEAREVEGWVDVDVRGPASDLRVPWGVSSRALHVAVMPDPTDGPTEAFVAAPVELGAAPVVEVRDPEGVVARVTATHFRDQWWRAAIEGAEEGVYRVRAAAPAAASLGGAVLTGGSTFELAEPDDGGGWQPVGPNSHAGEIDLGPGRHPHTYVMDQSEAVLWVSADGAATWRSRLIPPVPRGAPVELVADARRAGTIHLAINSDPGADTFEGRILRSDDHGRTWTSLPAPNVRMVDLEVEPGGDVLAAATDDGLHAGVDGVWEPVPGPWTSVRATHLLDDDLYVATAEGLWAIDGFTRGGRTPRAVAGARGEPIDDIDGNARLLAARSESRVYGSRDGGRTWRALFATPDGAFVNDLGVVGATAFATTFDDLWVGENRGTRWVRRGQPLPRLGGDDVAAHPSGRGILYAQNAGGVFWSDDGARSFTRIGVPGTGVLDLTIAASRSGQARLVAGTRWGVYGTPVPRKAQIRAADLEWGFSGEEGLHGSDTRAVVAAPSRPRVVYRTREATFLISFEIERSEDGGQTWRKLADGPETATVVHVDPHDWDRAIVGFAAFTGDGLLLTEDGGASWRRVRREAPPEEIVADPRDGDRLWLADAGGLHRSTDGGLTWTRVNDTPLHTVALDPEDPDRLIAGGERLFVSDDRGETLRPAFDLDLRLEVSDLLPDPHRPGVVYAATECPFTGGLPLSGRGVLRSTDGGRTWSSFSDGLDARCIRALALAPDGRHLFAGAAAAGVHRIRLTGRR